MSTAELQNPSPSAADERRLLIAAMGRARRRLVVTAVDAGVITVAVTGTNSLGKHVISTVTLTIGATEPDTVGSPAGRGEGL